MLNYYLHKIAKKITRSTHRNHHLKDDGWIISGPVSGKFSFKNRAILGFWDNSLMHLGDQLFHIGLIRVLQENGVEVIIGGNTPLLFLFESLKCTCLPVEKIKDVEGALIITKDDIVFGSKSIVNANSYLLGINYRLPGGRGSIGEILINEIQNHITTHINLVNNDGYWDIPSLNTPEHKIKLESNVKYFIYNDFVASNIVQAFFRKRMIRKIATKIKSDGYKIIYTGSLSESKSKKHSFVDIDARGIPIKEFFSLMKDPNISGVLSFDTFTMHIATLYKKDTFVVAKYKQNIPFLRERFIPMSKYLTKWIKSVN